MFIQQANIPKIAMSPFLKFEEEPDTCPTCLGKKLVDGKPCPTCGGSGDIDCIPFRFEEVDADELPEDDLDDLCESDDMTTVIVVVPCPGCGKQIEVTVSTKVVH